ncbi:MAG: ankyrin repeat domain-containing protein [Bacteroidales bacterium]|nr:ankyrin repeat domain-containing protein [Bacteroidales bacterium]
MKAVIRFKVWLFFATALLMAGKTFGQADSVITEQLNFQLLVASEKGNIPAVDSLLAAGAEVNATTFDGVTPLMYASQAGNIELVNLLIDKGAGLNLLPWSHISALLSAVIAGHAYVADTLICKGADINTRDADMVTALMYAAWHGDFTLTDMLIFYGADINLRDNRGNTALMFAVAGHSMLTAGLLLDADAPPDEDDKQGFTPLMAAVQNNDPEMVSLLLDSGADINLKSDSGLTPLAIAVAMSYDELTGILLASGARSNEEYKGMNYYELARRFGTGSTAVIMKKNAQAKIPKPRFRSFTLEILQQFNNVDYMPGIIMGLADPLYHASVRLGYMLRPWAKSAGIEKDPGCYYRFWEYRHVLTLDATKTWWLGSSGRGNRFGLSTALGAAYSFGTYRGSETRPDDLFRLLPQAGFCYCFSPVCIHLRYSRLNLKNDHIPDHWINVGIEIRFTGKKDRIRYKEMPELL